MCTRSRGSSTWARWDTTTSYLLDSEGAYHYTGPHSLPLTAASVCLSVVQSGEVNIDQAHRGYNMSSDGVGYRSVNPLFMKYTPTDGKFSGQRGYGTYQTRSTAESSLAPSVTVRA